MLTALPSWIWGGLEGRGEGRKREGKRERREREGKRRVEEMKGRGKGCPPPETAGLDPPVVEAIFAHCI